MHNGVFQTLEEVIDFYDDGGGSGRGFQVDNQTLPGDKLHLTDTEKSAIKSFLLTLTDTTNLNALPSKLPAIYIESLNNRRIGGDY